MSTVDEVVDDTVLEDITMTRGPVWVLISVPSAGGTGFDVNMEVGPALNMETLRHLLVKTVEAM